MDELYIGLMSGTSLNGVDAVVLELGKQHTSLLQSHSEAFPETLYRDLQQLITSQQTSLSRLADLDHQLAVVYSLAVKKLLHSSGLLPSQIQAIGCHGQTIYHQPEGERANSLQLGDPGFIAETTGISVVADLRRRDMAVGGQGAPMVPAFHAATFRSAITQRVIVNIGGIANITVLPAASDAAVTGFDTGPGNTLLDQWIARYHHQAFDRDGAWAASGRCIDELLTNLLAEPYFAKAPPKSTGRELFNLAWLEARLATDRHPAEDVQATLLELTCRSIAQAIQQHAKGTTEVYVCGGGAHNHALLQRLGQLLSPASVNTTEVLGVAPEWVEAAAFAWLAKQTLEGKSGNLPSVTGASQPVVLGEIHTPNTANGG